MIDGVPMKILFEEIAESDPVLFLSGSKRIVSESQFHHDRYSKHSCLLDAKSRVISKYRKWILLKLRSLNSIRVESPEHYSMVLSVDPFIYWKTLGTGVGDT